MSWINDQIERRLRTVRQDVRMRPIIDQVKLAGQAKDRSADALLAVAAQSARDSFVREGKAPSADQVRERAFLAAAAAGAEQPMTLKGLPAGADKTQHFFMSGLISLQVAQIADKLLPRGLAEKLGIGASISLGWLKEVYDQFFATGFNKEDLAADIQGAKQPFRTPVSGGRP